MKTQTLPQLRGEMTRRAILAEGERVFAELGYDRARLEDVAQGVGIRRPSIVHHFAGKQELYDAVEADIYASLHACSRAALDADLAPLDQLLALLDAWLDLMVARPTAARIVQRLVADVSPRHGNPVHFSELALVDLEAVVDRGVRTGAFRPINIMQVVNGVAASTLFYVCNGRQIGSSRTYDPADPKTLAEFRALIHRIAKAAVSAE
ncbi:TetR/AcrR family transcriptional regulator [Sphingomonas lycopersici]|uniref:TetR/AcrR family transcriptional regulator n=1 Tax=Sphingomonas lycopersici TaxID=2951807 RepID=A0AA41Z6M6_9SPHN|nr:TetR/AcrR family transcriptional regulator [Sphingomonas lycopersici]MCW6533804.1 TetR/AcrR family transcriptional regulator [Sphingomonas lycopersici]